MTKKQLADLREHIENQIESLRLELAALEASAKPVDLDEPIGRLSRMDSMASQAIGARGLSAARSRLAGLERALRRLDDPDFGLCEECGEEIPHGRLRAMPEATLCVNCAE